MRAPFGTLVLLFAVFLLAVRPNLVEGGSNGRNFITWDDFTVDEHRLTADDGEGNSGGGRVIVVDQQGGGHSKTVQGAVDMVKNFNTERIKIYIHSGTYREQVIVPATKPYISFIGRTGPEGPFPVITNNTKASDKRPDGGIVGTYDSATVTIRSDYFCATGITFQNYFESANQSADGNQAVALRVDGDRAMFYRVNVLGYQDTLLDNTGTHFFYRCFIQGIVDFIFGGAKSLYQDCIIYSLGDGAITAHNRDLEEEDTGFSFVGCQIGGTGGATYLGRPWGDYARVIFSYCYMNDMIKPQGWVDWDESNTKRHKTAVFGEFRCWGRGADMSERVPWERSLSYAEVKPFLGRKFINGNEWLRL